MTRFLQLALCLALLTGGSAWAACTGSSPNWSSSTDAASINTCIANASAGDTITVASGSATWGAPSGQAAAVIINKSVTLQGATTCTGAGATLSCTNGTTITDDTGTAWQAYVVNGKTINTQPSALLILASGARLTGFTFVGGAASKEMSGLVKVGHNTTSWRIDHCVITPSTTASRGIVAFGYGLVDHSYFADGVNDITPMGGDTRDPSDGTGVHTGGYNWLNPIAMGTANAIYIEDNKFVNTNYLDGAYDSYDGARVVFRYNYVHDTGIGGHGLDSSGTRSTLLEEWYGNTFNYSAGNNTAQIGGGRGGTGLAFDNIVNGDMTPEWFALLRNYRSDQAFGAYGDGAACDGTNWVDANRTGGQGYPCRDQVGRGPSTTPSTDWTNRNTASPAPVFSQALIPVYHWNNLHGGQIPTTANGMMMVKGSSSDDPPTRASQYHIVENRDFYNQDATNCPANPAGSCTAGVGRGTLANRPASCTASTEAGGGVAYWATDVGYWNSTTTGADGVLYRCSATNTWSLYYIPYSYPHPLQSGLAAPTGVTVP